MKLMVFEKGDDTALGVVDGEDLIDLSRLDAGLPADVGALAAGGDAAMERVRSALAGDTASARLPLAEARPALPVPAPGKFICMGLNFADHAKEGGHDVPDYPALFMRARTSLVAAEAPVIRPRCSEQLDYEAELVIVIGKTARHVAEDRALEHVFGYTLFNDVSVRDYQRKGAQWTAGKNFDGTGPLGPVVVTADALPPGASGLRIQSRLNGQVMQDSNTANMIFSTARTIVILSEFMTLEPGDLVALGTPEGVGHARRPPVWMKAGDIVEVEVDGVGVLRNPIVDEDAAA